MLLAHAHTLARARSYVAALADVAETFEASVAYERVLLQLDAIHGDDSPALLNLPADRRDVLHARAETAIAELVNHGVDELRIELVLDMLARAREQDAP